MSAAGRADPTIMAGRDEAVICTTCDDTGVVPTSSGRGSDGYDPCPDCTPKHDVSPEGWEIVFDRERAKRRAGRGCGVHIGDDVAGIPVRCGSLGRLCQRCKNSGAGADTREDSDLRGDEGVPTLGPVEGFTPAPVPDRVKDSTPEWAYFAEALAWYPGHGLTGAQVFGVVKQIRQALADGRITPADLGLIEPARATARSDEAADEIEALRGAVRSLAGWVRELDPHPSLDPCDYLTDEAEQAAVRRAFSAASEVQG